MAAGFRGALVALTLLAGCAVGGPVDAPVDAPPAPEKFAVAGAELVGRTGPLVLSHWPAEGEAKAAILGVHGFGDYAASTFAKAAPWWAAHGVEVFAYDQRGFGRNASRQRWPGPDALIDDLAAADAAVRAARPGLPLVVVGHSMGGGVALAAAGEGRLDADGLVLLAPAVWGGDELNPLYRAAAWIAAAALPDHRWTGQGVVRIQASDNVAALRALAADPVYFGRPSSRELMGLIRLMDRAQAAAPHDRIPTLAIWGAHDEVVPEDPVRDVVAAIPAPATYLRVETGWHLLLRDLHAETVWRDVLDWTLARTKGENGARPASRALTAARAGATSRP